jgi:hypothetical protein
MINPVAQELDSVVEIRKLLLLVLDRIGEHVRNGLVIVE